MTQRRIEPWSPKPLANTLPTKSIMGVCGITSSLQLLPSPLQLRVIVPVSVPSMGRIDLFENCFWIGMFETI